MSGHSIGNRWWASFFGRNSPQSNPLKQPLLVNRLSSDGSAFDSGPLSPPKPLRQEGAGAVRAAAPAIRPTDSKSFGQFAHETPTYDEPSGGLYLDASNVSADIYEDVCKGGAPSAMHAVAQPLREKTGKSVMYAQLRNHSSRPWDHRVLAGAQALGEASGDERIRARKILARYVNTPDAVDLLFSNVKVNGEAVWVDYRQFNADLGSRSQCLSDRELQELAASLELAKCLQSFVDSRLGSSWDKAYILFPMDAK